MLVLVEIELCFLYDHVDLTSLAPSAKADFIIDKLQKLLLVLFFSLLKRPCVAEMGKDEE